MAVPGDLERPFFGLSKQRFADLALKVSTIYHVGAWVNGILPYSRLRDTNVGGTIEALRLAGLAAHSRRHTTRNNSNSNNSEERGVVALHYVSTAAVFNCYPGGEVMREDHPLADTPAAATMDGYSRSKWIADRLVLHAQQHTQQQPQQQPQQQTQQPQQPQQKFPFGDISITIFRPGFISGHHKSGVGNQHDFDTRMFIGLKQMGMVPPTANSIRDDNNDPISPNRATNQKNDLISVRSHLMMKMDMSPVDHVASAIAEISNHAEFRGRSYHFMNPEGSLTVEAVLGAFVAFWCDRGESVREVESYETWWREVQRVPASNPLYPLKAAFGKDHFPGREGRRCDCSNTIEALTKLGMPAYVSLDRAYITALLKHLSSSFSS